MKMAEYSEVLLKDGRKNSLITNMIQTTVFPNQLVPVAYILVLKTYTKLVLSVRQATVGKLRLWMPIKTKSKRAKLVNLQLKAPA